MLSGVHKPDFFSFPHLLHVSLGLSQVLPEEFTSHSPPISEACAHCLTAGVPGPLYRSLCTALYPLQLATLVFWSPCCHLLTQAAGVPANLCPLPNPLLDYTLSPLNLVFFIFSSICGSSIHQHSHSDECAPSMERLFNFSKGLSMGGAVNECIWTQHTNLWAKKVLTI